MIEVFDEKLIASSQSAQSWSLRWHASATSKCQNTLDSNSFIDLMFDRAAKKQAEADQSANDRKSSARIAVPGTPRHVGIGAGARIGQTPRRRVGL